MDPQTQKTDQNPSEQPVAATTQTATAIAPVTSLAESVAEAATTSTPLSDGGVALAAQLADGKHDTILRKAYVGVLTFVGISASFAAGAAYLPLPQIAHQAPAQTAIAAESAPQETDPFAALTIHARSVVVYDAKTGEELYTRNPDLQLPLASITKVALMLAISEVLTPETIVTVSETALERGGGGLNLGEIWRARDLIDFTLISSSNAGAEALAEAADNGLRARYPDAPIGSAAVWRMNKIAQDLGLAETYFINATGLDESPSQAGSLGSARDIAELFAYAIKENRALFAGTTRSNETLAPLNFPERTATNTNNALLDIPGIIMGKTGTTDLAGGNLAIAFNVTPERPVVIVVLGSTESGRYEDVRNLVEATTKTLH